MNERYSMASLATQLGVNRSTIMRWFHRANIKPSPQGVTLRQLIMAGMKRPGTEPGQWFPTPFENLCTAWGFDRDPKAMTDAEFDVYMAKALNKELP